MDNPTRGRDSLRKFGKYSPSRRKGPHGPRRAARQDESDFRLRIHPRLRPVLERIGVPEPRPFVPDPFQVEALEVLEESDVLVTAPTGAGKTYIAVEAVKRLHSKGKNCWYASPLKALSNAKYEEFSGIFGASQVGILTGDRKENPQAPIIVGTTEILRNQLYDAMHRGENLEVDLVVLDEAHYLGDEDRGVVWEEVLIYLPSRVKVLLLSATIENASEIADWLEWLRGTPCRWVTAKDRPVPLFPLFLFPSGELTPLSSRKGLFRGIDEVEPRSFGRADLPPIPRLLEALRQANLLPAIFFLKSRSDCERSIALCPPSKRDPETGKAFRSRLGELLDRYPFLEGHRHLPILRRARVGAHHGGQLPHWKILMEKLMQDGLLEAIFSTSTVAAGVNFPARTVVVLQSDRFNGREFVELSATDLLQMTGRAGRRGMDEIGFVLVVPGRFQDPQLIHNLLRSPPDPIDSRIHINFSMVLNLLLSHNPEEIRRLFACSLATFQNLHRQGAVNRKYREIRRETEEWMPQAACGSLEELAEARGRFQRLRHEIREARKTWRKEASRGAFRSRLTPGRLFLDRKRNLYATLEAAPSDKDMVKAVRVRVPPRFKKGSVKVQRVALHRVAQLGQETESPPPVDRKDLWEPYMERTASLSFAPLAPEAGMEEESPRVRALGRRLGQMMLEKGSLPCGHCDLFGPCQKSTQHPFSSLVQAYLEIHSRLQSVQEKLWNSFQSHYRFLEAEGYVEEGGKLTPDGLWAGKLRLDQPLLVSEAIRRGVLPRDDPPLLAGLVAPFVMDRDRAGDERSSTSLMAAYPELAVSYLQMIQGLAPLQERLQAAGFGIPLLPFWALIIVYQWAREHPWESLRELSGMDDGDLAMVILRTADHLRQIESLHETHPRLADSARQAIGLILREPVLVD